MISYGWKISLEFIWPQVQDFCSLEVTITHKGEPPVASLVHKEDVLRILKYVAENYMVYTEHK